MKSLRRSFIASVLLAIIAGCGSSEGPDSISSRPVPTAGTLSNCADCHIYATGSRRQIMGAGGDFGGNAAVKSHHIAGASDPTTTQCLVCHDLSAHMRGTVLLKNADTGASIAYDPSNPSTLETFCLSCHDILGATTQGPNALSPFSDGRILGVVPYMMSKEIETHWNKTYGHKQQGLTCLGNGNPNPNTGCHSNGHGSTNVGILAKNMTLPIPPPDRYIENDYQLCFDCHSAYLNVTKEVIFGVRENGAYDSGYGPGFANPPYHLSAIQTKFRDQNNRGTGKAYDDSNLYIDFWLSGYNSVNLHWVHIASFPWRYRDSIASYISCTACHNVHGTNSQWGMTYDEMSYQRFQSGSDWYGKMGATNPYTLGQFPISCDMRCHDTSYSVGFDSSSWYEPPNE